MDIQTKDGITLRGIPDGTPDDAIKARIEKIRAEMGNAQKSIVDQIPGKNEKYNPPKAIKINNVIFWLRSTFHLLS